MNNAEIEKNCAIIKSELEKELINGDISGCQDKLMKLVSLSGLSAELIKYGKQNYLYAQKNIIELAKEQGLNPSILKLKIEGELWEESSLLTYCERLNAAITHALDSIRTIISLYKSELENSLK